MSTTPPDTSFSACAAGDLCLIRVMGPGVCRESGRFETLLLEVDRMKPGRLVIDLSDCPRMDSTFAGAFLRLADRAAVSGYRVFLAGARDQVPDLLDTLCLTDVFESVPLPDPAVLARVELADHDLPREQIMALSLDGHERLAALNPANACRFAPLLKVLREQLPGAAAPSGCPGGGAAGQAE